MKPIISSTLATPMPRTNYNQTDKTKADYLVGRENIVSKDEFERVLAEAGGDVTARMTTIYENGESGQGVQEFQHDFSQYDVLVIVATELSTYLTHTHFVPISYVTSTASGAFFAILGVGDSNVMIHSSCQFMSAWKGTCTIDGLYGIKFIRGGGGGGGSGEDGVGVKSVKQTTTSTADGGINVVTVTLTNGVQHTFEVRNGSKGSAGKSCTHSWDGTTLTVTSASGTSSANLKGEKGDPYTLTEADKQYIVDTVLEALPTWEGGSY